MSAIVLERNCSSPSERWQWFFSLDCGQTTTYLALFPENFSQLDSEGGIDIARPPHSLCELVTNLFLLLAGQLLLLP